MHLVGFYYKNMMHGLLNVKYKMDFCVMWYWASTWIVFKLIKMNWIFYHHNIIPIIIMISFYYSLWSTGHPWRASKLCDLQLSPWPHSMIFLYFLFHPLLSFATFALSYLLFYTAVDSNRMQFSLLLLLLYIRCVLSSSIFFFNIISASDYVYISFGKYVILCTLIDCRRKI
jgi:hypothetical protein